MGYMENFEDPDFDDFVRGMQVVVKEDFFTYECLSGFLGNLGITPKQASNAIWDHIHEWDK
jgi:hypothetical protein